ncbi:PIG-L deacetylase family protein [Arthrobacter sp.]|uniref:PIG-L deacetylase family protein n=1 Tax=Arthrobacter sp. TaxID=1667 RepID=UPI003A8DA080
MPEQRSIAVVVAHPDDDAYGCAGSIALHAGDPGFRFVLVIATDGAAGDIADGFPATRATLGALRRVESRNAWAAHGVVPDRHEWLDYDDGGLAGVDPAELAARVEEVLLRERPSIVCTFGPDGITGHRDHIAIGRATDTAFHAARRRGGPGLVRLVHGALRRSTFDRWNEHRRRTGAPPWDPDREYDLHPVPDGQIDIEVDTSSVAPRIVAGLLEHRSQQHVLHPPGMDEVTWAHQVSREHFVLAWPRQPRNGRLLTDLFEGL